MTTLEPERDRLGMTAARVAGTPDVWLTAFSSGPWDHATPDGLRLVLDEEVLMTRLLEPSDPPATSVELDAHGHRLHAVVRDGDVVAAAGWVAVVGEHATFDRIETHPDHRRRGLASQVMRTLEAWALEQGARTGLLAASAEGQALYVRLGWQVTARMTTLGSAPAPT
ncbi:MAG: GNAT family N-acetyltransferase [Nocardioides sp.]|jgi:GNAT superfamily N-acetyltransferase